ncbi:MAG: molybdopterin-dependent oxidoreductase [Chloroflexota bacterium]
MWNRLSGIFIILILLVTACTPVLPSNLSTATCDLPPVVIPTLPAEIPGYNELDRTTGLHITDRVQEIDLESYRLEVSGGVDHPLSLSYDDLRCMPKIEARLDLICPRNFLDIATWAGASLKHILDLAGVQEGAIRIRLVSADGYSALVPMDKALSEENFLAYEWEGEPLPILHGFPVRAVFPGMDGMFWVKWLIKIEVH